MATGRTMATGIALIIAAFVVMGALLNAPNDLWAAFGFGGPVLRDAITWGLPLIFVFAGLYKLVKGLG